MITPKILITGGEPAGIGPDIIVTAAMKGLNAAVIADAEVLKQRAKQLNLELTIVDYHPNKLPQVSELAVIHQPCAAPVVAGELNPTNAPQVIRTLDYATELCLSGEFDAMVTAPVNKAIINEAGIAFSGHTEYLARACEVKQVVMLLSCQAMNVALITTHLPLKEVSKAITFDKIYRCITLLHQELQTKFGIEQPIIYVAGLNPHAGESGHIGSEEIEVIEPALRQLTADGIDINGPFAADTMFSPENCAKADAFVAMYHDQGLSVLKYAGFGQAANITLGLPIIRTSVDHGTALPLAGSGTACEKSLLYALTMASDMARRNQ